MTIKSEYRMSQWAFDELCRFIEKRLENFESFILSNLGRTIAGPLISFHPNQSMASNPDHDSATLENPIVFKEQLKMLLSSFVEDDGLNQQNVNEAKKLAYVLRKFKVDYMVANDKALSIEESFYIVALNEYKCPLSKQLMIDSVIISSGEMIAHPSKSGCIMVIWNVPNLVRFCYTLISCRIKLSRPQLLSTSERSYLETKLISSIMQ